MRFAVYFYRIPFDPMEQYRREAGVLFRRVRRSAAIAETASDFRPVRRERNGRG